ncbi:ImmA/IrrE family metallo-endopeptidase [Undibacterium sp. Ji42W]|uniref:ImmA/IrrE family metallo-endopeptidase n=1 Tax=Undibacterium sp. Ji42W TaxID=3413039 RepID=UPI003BF14795
MHRAWNPTRRNKNIGTKAQGHGNDNRMAVPEAWGKIFYEKLTTHVLVRRDIAGRDMRFFVEPTRSDCFYACSIDDICRVLGHCPPEVLSAFDFIVLRQPTRKQRILRPVWGRAIFSFEIRQQCGAAIVIEAHNLDGYQWPKSLSQESQRELARLQQDGHAIARTRQGYSISSDSPSLRHTILYRTLLHEIGHHVDHKHSTTEEWADKTKATKEDYAHRFGAELYARLEQQAVVPFSPILDEAVMAQDGLDLAWFCPPTLRDSPSSP